MSRPGSERRAVVLLRGRSAARFLPALLPVALDLAHELVGEPVDRRAHVARRLPDPERVPLGEDGRLRNLVRADRGVLLDRELDLHLHLGRELLVQLSELLLGVTADRLAELEILALHLKTHLASCGDAGVAAESSGAAPPRRSAHGLLATAQTESPNGSRSRSSTRSSGTRRSYRSRDRSGSSLRLRTREDASQPSAPSGLTYRSSSTSSSHET